MKMNNDNFYDMMMRYHLDRRMYYIKLFHEPNILRNDYYKKIDEYHWQKQIEYYNLKWPMG